MRLWICNKKWTTSWRDRLLNVKTVETSHLKVNAVIANYFSSFSNLLVIISVAKYDPLLQTIKQRSKMLLRKTLLPFYTDLLNKHHDAHSNTCKKNYLFVYRRFTYVYILCVYVYFVWKSYKCRDTLVPSTSMASWAWSLNTPYTNVSC